MVEEISNKFERAMKKGFISTLILIVLDNNPSHGYQIIKDIEDRTHGMWKPTTSTIYTILDSLKEKSLIKIIQQESDDRKISYELTPKGKETLQIMLQKEKEMRESLKSIISSSFGIPEEVMNSDQGGFPFKGPFIKQFEGKNIEEKLEILKLRKEKLTKILQNIERQISELEKEINK